MKDSSVFLESFLDGFTMRGFGSRLERPGAATALMAPDPEDDLAGLLEPERLHNLPDEAFRQLQAAISIEASYRARGAAHVGGISYSKQG